jgi:hypothetical protein
MRVVPAEETKSKVLHWQFHHFGEISSSSTKDLRVEPKPKQETANESTVYLTN